MNSAVRVSIIIPVYNDCQALQKLLSCIEPLAGADFEIIVVDGGSSDGSAELAQQYGCSLLAAEKGRALQMNAGARMARGDYLWFVHADSLFRQNPFPFVRQALPGLQWGRFQIRLDAPGLSFRLIETMMNWRTCVSKMVTGDHGIIIRKSLFEQVQGFDAIPLMEDIALSKKLSFARLSCFSFTLYTSARRWQKNGVWRTVFLMWSLRLAYFFGASPESLHRVYYGDS